MFRDWNKKSKGIRGIKGSLVWLKCRWLGMWVSIVRGKFRKIFLDLDVFDFIICVF